MREWGGGWRGTISVITVGGDEAGGALARCVGVERVRAGLLI